VRILRLDLAAYGPFTGHSIDFSSAAPGLHVLYGANEAGKSSTLRALKAWLFGFPERTSDNFLHANDQLLVGGTLLAEDGGELSFQRRKKRKADLLDQEGNPMAAETLAAFFPVHDQALFDTLYGITHEDLIRGGEDILAQRGDVGEALFSAGAGLSSLRSVLNSLDAEAEEIFKARGSKNEINQALSRYHELQKKIRQTSLSGREWQELNKALQEAGAKQAALEEKLAGKNRQRRQLERISHSLPQLVLRKSFAEQLAALGEVAVLPGNFAADRREVEKQLHALQEKQAINVRKLNDLREKRQLVCLPAQILDFEENIEELHQRLGGYQKAMEDRPRLDGMRISCKTEAGQFLKLVRHDLPLESVESLRPVLARAKMVRELAGRHGSIVQSIEQAHRGLSEAERELAGLDGELRAQPEMRDTLQLGKAVHSARKAGKIDALCADRQKACGEKRNASGREIERLVLWSGQMGDLASLPLPLEKTVQRYDALFFENEARRLSALAEEEKAVRQLAAVRAEQAKIIRPGLVPSEEELGSLRMRRDQGWGLLRRQWLGHEDVSEESRQYHAELSLPDAFAQNIAAADLVADRLRREADRVHAFAALQNEEARLQDELDSLREKMVQLEGESERLKTEWLEVWKPCAIMPLPPKEMLAWLAAVEKILFKGEELERAEQEVVLVEQERLRLKDLLLRELARLGSPFISTGLELEPVLLQAEETIRFYEKLAEARRRLAEKKSARQDDMLRLAKARAEGEEALFEWQKQWQDATLDLGGTRHIYPAEALDLLENLKACFDRLKDAAEFAKRIGGIDHDTAEFCRHVGELAREIAPDLVGLPPVQAVVQLKARLNQARQDRTLLKGYDESIGELENEAIILAAEAESIDLRLRALCSLAGCSTPGELESAERISRQFGDLAARLKETETLLIEGAGGLSLDALEEEAAQFNPDDIPEKIAALVREIEQELAPESKRLSELIGEIRTRLSLMDGNAQAAVAAEEASHLLAKIRRLSERYLVLKLAAHALHSEIERYRAENQDPVLALASSYFARLTLDAYSALRADENDRGEPVLVGVKGKDLRVGIPLMSSGTRDQLYLALRLASLRLRLEKHGPVPFVVDDILVNFDDQRSLATLEILAEIARENQVILLTHHSRIVAQSRSLPDSEIVRIHELRS